MRPVIPWRSRVALWLLLPAIACVYAFCGLYFDLSSVRGYWPAVVAGSAIFLFFPCPSPLCPPPKRVHALGAVD